MLTVDELSYIQDKTFFKKCFYKKFSTETCLVTINLGKKELGLQLLLQSE